MLDGRFLSDAMAPDDHDDFEVRGAVVHRLMPLMRESGYRDGELEILDTGAIRRGNESRAMTRIEDFGDDLRVEFWRRLGIGVPF